MASRPHRHLILSLLLCICVCAHALTGDWRGSLSLGIARLPLVFHFSQAEDVVTCTMDSPNQNARGIHVTVNLCTADSLSLSIPAIGGTYTARIAPQAITGVFSQMGHSLQLNLSPDQPLSERRPQTPKPPFPYETIDTVFTSADGTILSGTLTFPLTADSRRKPAVIMVTGSGPQNRDEEIMDHRPFAVIADALARQGIISFRYDDRGVGRSGGSFAASGLPQFTADASAALKFLRSFPQVAKAGVLGHSEGGTIAMLLAGEGEPDFAISLAGVAEPGKNLLLDQNRHALVNAGLTPAQVDDVISVLSHGFDNIEAGLPLTPDSIAAFCAGKDIPSAVIPSLESGLRGVQTPYMMQLISLHPERRLGNIHCPLLALNGDKDTQVNAQRNLAVISSLVPSAETREYPGLNHLFQPCATGESNEYADIPTTISPDVLSDIAVFILAQ